MTGSHPGIGHVPAPLDPSQDEQSIAVVGMALHLPGAQDVDGFWQNLREGVESIRRFSVDELEAAGVDPSVLRDPRYVRSSGVLAGMRAFDAGFFGFSPRDAAVMDPQTRHFLECVWHAMEHAGHVPEAFDGTIGVFAGAGASQYFWRNVVRNPELMDSVGYFLLRHTGNDKDFVATRASYEFNLTGPSVGVQTACSTSLVAIHYAAQSLLSWECDMALAGGVTIEQPHEVGYLYEEGEILSPDGHCRSFDASSMGTVFGSGAGVVVLRRLADALADGDTIHAVIRGSAVNNDGAGKVSYLAPGVDGQAKAVSEALAVAGVDPGTIGLVEGHGTGTPVGDPIEVAALTQAFRAGTEARGYCALGSVKSNIGHLDTAAGVASFIKAVLAVKHGVIPPTVHFQKPNPLLQLETSPFYINAEARPWPDRQRPRRAGVNSLGVGGTNAHVIVQEPPELPPSGPARPWQLLTLSARTPQALEDASRQLMEALEAETGLSLADVSHTLRCGRRRFAHRRALVSASPEEAVEQLALGKGPGWVSAQGTEDEGSRDVAFLFAGGGSQYPGMGRELYDAEPVYRKVIDRCVAHMKAHEDLDLIPLLFPEPGSEEEVGRLLRRPSRALPALFAVQLAQARLWISWGVRPSALLGHSMGEYTAACLAGVFRLEDALSLVGLRGRLFETLDPGAMVSVQLDEPRLEPLLGEHLSIAAVNAPEVVVAAGPVPEVEALEARLEGHGIDYRRIHIDVAAHSAMLEPILGRFRERVASLELREPEIPLLSNLTGNQVGAEVVDPEYWVRHLRMTVRFSDGLGRILESGDSALLEVGPGRTLTTLARMHPGYSPDRAALYSLPHPGEPRDALAFQLGALGALWAHGVQPDWDAFDEGRDRRRVPLPGYPFQREDHFVDPPEAGAVRTSADPEATPVLSDDPADWLQQRSWRLAPPASRAEGREVGRILLLTGEGEFEAEFSARLEARGHEVVEVRPGDRFGREETGYRVSPARPEDWQALIAELGEAGRLPDTIVHAWALGEEARVGLDQAFFAPLHLIQALEAREPGRSITLVVTASRVFPGAAGGVQAERAALLGPARVAPREIPTLTSRLVAVEGIPGDPARRARYWERLADEIEAGGAETVVAHRGVERWVEKFAPFAGGATGAAGVPDGPCLITGGLGGIGPVAARVLVQQGARRIALLGRSGLPPRSTWDAWRAEHPGEFKTHRAMAEVERLEAMGAEVRVVRADVTNPQGLREAIRTVEEAFGPLKGVVHAAGVLDDGPLLDRTPDQARAVLGAKAAGVRALDDALGERKLELYWLFSSVSAVIGAPGQIDYAAANAVLDAYAHERAERTGEPVLALAWGAWREVGMAAELAGEARYEDAALDPDRVRSLDHPLFNRIRSTAAGGAAYTTDFTVARHWMLAEHELRRGGWVLPGSGYVEIIRSAADLEAPGRPFSLRDLVFRKPFRVEVDETRELEVRLKPGRDGGFDVSVCGRSAGGPWLEHATARLLEEASVAFPVNGGLASVRDRLGAPVPRTPQPHPVMDFGPRWANIAAVSDGDGEALVEHRLPAGFEKDLEVTALHPALLDMATAGATHLVPGVDPSKDFLIPAGYGRLELHRPLDASPSSHIRLGSVDPEAGLVSFDVTVYGATGDVALEIQDFSMIRVEGDELADVPEDRPGWLEDAISPAEGEAVMRFLLDHASYPHILVSRRPVGELLREAARAPAVRSRRTRTATVPSRVLLPEVGAALEEHGAVREAVALGSRDPSEPARVVAFVAYGAGQQATASELRRFLKARVERRWVPQNFMEVVSLPRGPDGSVRVEELRDPFAVVDDYVAPRTATETAIAEIWAELLGLERVGIHDNFLDVGGHSLVGIRVLLRIQQATGIRIEANALTMQTLEQLAAEVDRAV